MNIFKIITLQVIVIIQLGITAGASADELPFSGVTASDSTRAMNININMVHDAEGNIFIQYPQLYKSSPNAPKLAKWDGTKLYIFSEADGLRYGVVRGIIADNNKGVWMASDNGIAYYHDGEIEHYQLPQPGNPQEGFRKVAQYTGNDRMIMDDEGYIWAIVNRYDQEEVYTGGDFSRYSKYTELWYFKDGIWALQEDMVFVNAHWPMHHIRLWKDHQGMPALTLIEGSEDFNEVAGQLLFKITRDSIIKKEAFFEDYIQGSNPYFRVRKLLPIDNKKLLIAYESPRGSPNIQIDPYEGFSFYNTENETWEHFGMPGYEDEFDYITLPSARSIMGGHPENFVTSLLKAPGTGVWMGMQNEYHRDDVFDKKGGGLYFFNTDDYSFKRFSPQKQDFIEMVEFGPGRKLIFGQEPNFIHVTGIAYDKEGDLWVASQNRGLFRIPAEHLPPESKDSFNEPRVTKPAFNIYPSLLRHGDNFTLELSTDGSEVIEVTFYDLLGRAIISMPFPPDSTSFTINSEKLKPAVYLVSVQQGNFSETKKIIITN